MDFNVSSLENKTSQNKINTCMKSVKDIIYGYRPFENKDLDYGIFEYEGPISSSTKIDIEGKTPTVDVPVIGSSGGISFHCGTLRNTGVFEGRDLNLKSFSKNTSTTITSWNYPGKVEYTSEVKVGVTDISSFTIPGTIPLIKSEFAYGEKEQFYTSTDPEEVLLECEAMYETGPGAWSGEYFSVKVKQCTEYKDGICLAVINDIFSKEPIVRNTLKIGFTLAEGSTDKYHMLVYADNKSSKCYVSVSDTPFAKKLFGKEVGKEVHGTDPQTFNYSSETSTVEEEGFVTITTHTKQPQLNRENVVKEGDKWIADEKYQVEDKTVIEKTGTSSIENIKIYQIYE